MISKDVIAAAEATQRKYGVPASVTIAQYGIESGWGKSVSGKNNYFGIKAGALQRGTYRHTREENTKGQSYYIDAKFADYDTLAEGFEAHAALLAKLSLYKPAMDAWTKPPYDLEKGVELMAQHYATAKNYPSVLMSVIHSMGLVKYDREAATA